MLRLLANVFVTAFMVVVATMGTAGLAGVATYLTAVGASDTPPDVNVVAGTIAGAFAMSVAAGAVFSVGSLFVAAVTMPPTLGLAKLLRLPRPLVDIVGGGLAGAWVGTFVIEALESLASAKGGSAPGGDMVPLLVGFGLIGGGALGHIRHTIWVQKRQPAPAPAAQFA